jgi:CRP-like cAMP-binding protein
MGDLDQAALTERVLRLGNLSPWNRLTTAELDLIASAGREVVAATRTLLVPAEERSSALFVALSGRLRAVRNGQPVPGDPVRAFYGGASLLGDSVISADVVAEPGTVLYVLDRDTFFSVLEEHGALQRSLLRVMSRQVIDMRGEEIVTSGAAAGPQPAALSSADLLSRMRILRETLGLEWHSLPVIAQLARAALVRRTKPGGAIWQKANGPASVVVVLEGAVDVLRPGVVTKRVRPGEGVGMVEALAGTPIAYEGVAATDTLTVEVTAAELQEAIEDHDDFCQDLVRVVALELNSRTFKGLVGAHA